LNDGEAFEYGGASESGGMGPLGVGGVALDFRLGLDMDIGGVCGHAWACVDIWAWCPLHVKLSFDFFESGTWLWNLAMELHSCNAIT